MEKDKSRRVYIGNGKWVYHGMQVIAVIKKTGDEDEDEDEVDGIVSIPPDTHEENQNEKKLENSFFICQNYHDGRGIEEQYKFGKDYSWVVRINSDPESHGYGCISSGDTASVTVNDEDEYVEIKISPCKPCDISLNSIQFPIITKEDEEYFPDDWIPTEKDLEFFKTLG